MKKFIPVILLFVCSYGNAQIVFSFLTDVNLTRNFSPKQKFWAIGQTLHANFHFTEKETLYASVGYFWGGNFTNKYTATAKSGSTIPSSFAYDIKGKLKSNSMSIGLKHFWWGAFDNESSFNIYTTSGFGIMFGRISNTYSTSVDTSLYNNPDAPLEGKGKFKRLTFDLGLGVEYPIGGTIYVYSDLRTSLPTSNYPSDYLHSNEKIPLPLIIGVGLRILFSYDY